MGFTSWIHKRLHQLFFPGLKIKPQKKWRNDLAAYGMVKDLSIRRAGKVIAACLVSPSIEVRGTAIFGHPLSRRAKYFFADGVRIKHYLDLGYQVILFDFNGFGESDKIDLYFWKDAAAVIDYAIQQFFQYDMVFHGVSFGSFHGIRALSHLPPNSKVVLENTNRSLYDYWKHWWYKALAIRILEHRLVSPQFIKDMNVRDALQQLNRPDLRFLFITCSDDEYTPRVEMEELASFLASEKQFLHVEHAKHLEAPQAIDQYHHAIKGILADAVV